MGLTVITAMLKHRSEIAVPTPSSAHSQVKAGVHLLPAVGRDLSQFPVLQSDIAINPFALPTRKGFAPRGVWR